MAAPSPFLPTMCQEQGACQVAWGRMGAGQAQASLHPYPPLGPRAHKGPGLAGAPLFPPPPGPRPIMKQTSHASCSGTGELSQDNDQLMGGG